MTCYERLLNLNIRHPLIDVSSLALLPGRETAHYLARNRLRLSFTQGRLSIFGQTGNAAVNSAGRTGLRELCFYVFCRDPYFTRASALPLYAPGREFLFVALGPEAGGADPFVDVMPARPACLEEIAAARKNRPDYPGSTGRPGYTNPPHGLPPCALLSLPPPASGTFQELAWEIAAREVVWAYLITPRPRAPELLAIIGGPEPFVRETGHEDGLLLVSSKPLPLASAGRRGLSLVVGADAMPLMENLPSPGLGQVQWDAGTGGYRGTVALDLRRYGVTL